ncbi:MAG: TMEM175 family protein [Candidatus Nanopelagicales bacterium]
MADPEFSTSSTERMLNFSDAVVAIAVTLLILPLADIQIPDNNVFADTHPLQYVWETYQSLIVGFAISWGVIIMFWLAHHRIFGQIERMNGAVIRWNLVWLFAIVVFPFPVSLLSQSGMQDVGEVITFYLFDMFVISISLAMIGRQTNLHPQICRPDARTPSARDGYGYAMSGYIGLLALLSLVAPQVALWGLVGLGILGPVLGARASRRDKALKAAETAGAGEAGEADAADAAAPGDAAAKAG